jgi:hypothetical protein
MQFPPIGERLAVVSVHGSPIDSTNENSRSSLE